MREGLNQFFSALGEPFRVLPNLVKWAFLTIFCVLGLLLAAWLLLSLASLSTILALVSSGLVVLGLSSLALAGVRTAFISPKYALVVGGLMLAIAVVLKLPWEVIWHAVSSISPQSQSPGEGSLAGLLDGARRTDISRTGLSIIDLWVPGFILLNALLIHQISQGRKHLKTLFTGNLVWLASLIALSLVISGY